MRQIIGTNIDVNNVDRDSFLWFARASYSFYPFAVEIVGLLLLFRFLVFRPM